jgi:hypothetical protein
MTPGEISACYRLYAAHRKSHEICTFPRTATVIAGDLGNHAVLLRLHTGLGGLARAATQMMTYARPSTLERCWHRSVPRSRRPDRALG